MDDEFEDRVFYQAFVSQMKLLSKFAVGLSSLNTTLAWTWRICRLYLLRPEVLFFGLIVCVFFFYLQAVDVWSRGLLGRLQDSWNKQRAASRLKVLQAASSGDHQSWHDVRLKSAAFAILGRRPRMEDRFFIEENIDNTTGISFYAVFDGHGGEFAADYARDILVKNIRNKIIETTKLLRGDRQQQQAAPANAAGIDAVDYSDYDASPYAQRKPARQGIGGGGGGTTVDESNKENDVQLRRRGSLRKTLSSEDDNNINNNNNNNNLQTDIFTNKLNALMRSNSNSNNNNNKDNNNIFNKQNIDSSTPKPIPASFEAKCYIENGQINYGRMITDEVLAADYKLVETAKKTTNIAGTTALIAIMHGQKLVVANVGDSRGVMYDSRGVAIPLSFDHKPQQVRERKRIRDAGGFIAFRGVWRVAGILATSRALGDYPLKDKNLVIANPDILTFDLKDHNPLFLILASDGLWDTFSNEEACSYIKEHMQEPDFGARGLAMQSYHRGSVDNITVMIIVFKQQAVVAAATATAAQQSNSAQAKLVNRSNSLKVNGAAPKLSRSNSLKQ